MGELIKYCGIYKDGRELSMPPTYIARYSRDNVPYTRQDGISLVWRCEFQPPLKILYKSMLAPVSTRETRLISDVVSRLNMGFLNEGDIQKVFEVNLTRSILSTEVFLNE